MSNMPNNPKTNPNPLTEAQKLEEGQIQAKKGQSKLSLKDMEFKKNLLKHKFNQTKAYGETYPDSSPKANESNGSK